MISKQRTVLRLQRYVHNLVLILRLIRSTTAAYWSPSLAKCWIPWRFIRAAKSELKNICHSRSIGAVGGALGCAGARKLLTGRIPRLFTWRLWSWPTPPKPTWNIRQLRWPITSFRHSSWRCPAYRLGRSATGHQFLSHKYNFWWNNAAPACAPY